MNKNHLIKQIKKAFKGVKLEDGVGLWESQGLDDYLTVQECKKLRRKDEKEDWNKIPLIDLYTCSSSLSFFDAKGMRFHMPIFLLFALDVFEKEEDELYKKKLVSSTQCPEVEYHLLDTLRYLNDTSETGDMMRKYNMERFSLFNAAQIGCIIGFLEFQMKEIQEYYNEFYAREYGTDPSAAKTDKRYVELEKGITYWQQTIQDITNHRENNE